MPSNGCDIDTGAAVVFTPAAPLGLSGVRPTARPTAEFSYRCYATGPPQNRPCTSWSRPGGSTWADPCNVTTVAELSAPAGAVLAAAVTYGDGRETLAIALEWWVLGQAGLASMHCREEPAVRASETICTTSDPVYVPLIIGHEQQAL